MPVETRAAEQPLADRYELREVLGRGATGEVRAAWDRHLDRPVAVKLMRPDLAADPTVRRRFAAEAQAAGRLSHPNVVTIYDTGDLSRPETPYIVMERLPGTTLRDAIAAGPLGVSDGRELALQMLAALAAAHRAGLVHRDIKPSNVLSAAPGHWKVADFGIAKSLAAASDETVTGLVVGTPAYLAPERLYGRPATVASDLFSVGVVLYEALTGRRPFETSPTYPWSGALAGRPAIPVRSLRPDVQPALAAVVDRALQLDPRDRFGSAAAMANALVPRPAGPARASGRERVAGARRMARVGAALAGTGIAATLTLLLLSSAPGSPGRLGADDNTPRSAPATAPIAAVAPTSTSSPTAPVTAAAPAAAATPTTGPAATGSVSSLTATGPAASGTAAGPPAADPHGQRTGRPGHRASRHGGATHGHHPGGGNLPGGSDGPTGTTEPLAGANRPAGAGRVAPNGTDG